MQIQRIEKVIKEIIEKSINGYNDEVNKINMEFQTKRDDESVDESLMKLMQNMIKENPNLEYEIFSESRDYYETIIPKIEKIYDKMWLENNKLSYENTMYNVIKQYVNDNFDQIKAKINLEKLNLPGNVDDKTFDFFAKGVLVHRLYDDIVIQTLKRNADRKALTNSRDKEYIKRYGSEKRAWQMLSDKYYMDMVNPAKKSIEKVMQDVIQSQFKLDEQQKYGEAFKKHFDISDLASEIEGRINEADNSLDVNINVQDIEKIIECLRLRKQRECVEYIKLLSTKISKEAVNKEKTQDEVKEERSEDKKTQIDQEDERIDDLKDEMEQPKKENEAQMDQEDGRISELENVIEQQKRENEAQIATKDGRIGELENAIEQQKRENEAQIATKDGRIGELENVIEQQKRENEAQIAQKNGTIAELQAQINELRSRNEQLLSENTKQLIVINAANNRMRALEDFILKQRQYIEDALRQVKLVFSGVRNIVEALKVQPKNIFEKIARRITKPVYHEVENEANDMDKRVYDIKINLEGISKGGEVPSIEEYVHRYVREEQNKGNQYGHEIKTIDDDSRY